MAEDWERKEVSHFEMKRWPSLPFLIFTLRAIFRVLSSPAKGGKDVEGRKNIT